MKALLLSVIVLLAFVAQAGARYSREVNPNFYNVVQARCLMQKDVLDAQMSVEYPMLRSSNAVYAVNLPGGVQATLRSSDSGYSHTWHTLRVSYGGGALETEVSENTRDPHLRRLKDLRGRLRTQRLEVRGRIHGHEFTCEAEVQEVAKN